MNTTVQEQNQPARAERQPDRGFVLPAANISATENEYLLEVEMPGVDKSGLEITVEGNELTITGWRKNDAPQGKLFYTEWPQADFRRVFELGPDVDTGRIDAQLEQGILKLRLPKSERAKPRKIQISD